MRQIGISMVIVMAELIPITGAARAEPATGPAVQNALNLVPWPKSVKVNEGRMALTGKSRIVATEQELVPLAQVLSEEIYLLTGTRLGKSKGEAGAGDIALALSDKFQGEAYELAVTDKAEVRGGGYGAVAWGTATLLQALITGKAKLALPRLVIEDHPDAGYRGFMEDVARQLVSIGELERAVMLCRFYKVRYLHLHLNDDHAWTFPSKAFPKLGSANRGAHSGPAPRVFDLDELKGLVRYADARGVTLVPELEGPGHSGALRIPMPDTFDSPGEPGGRAHLGIINMAKEEAYAGLDTLAGEMADVFQSSPYIHIGCDEVGVGQVKRAKEYESFIKQQGLKDAHDLFGYYVQRMVEIVKKHGKTPIAWEGVATGRVNPDDLIIMLWTTWNGPAAERYLNAGFRTLNAPNAHFNSGDLKWNYAFDLTTFGVEGRLKTVEAGHPQVLGGQLQDWESRWCYAEPTARKTVAARAAALWNARQERSFDEFAPRHARADLRLEQMLRPAALEDASEETALFPHNGSIKYRAPRLIDSVKGIQRLRAHRLFVKPVTVTLSTSLPGAQVRFLQSPFPSPSVASQSPETPVGRKPRGDWPAYAEPIRIDESGELCFGLVSEEGQPVGPEQRVTYERVNYEETLTYGKPVTASKMEGECEGEYVVDGFVMRDMWRGWWGANPYPQWIKIDLEKVYKLDRLIVFPYWDGHRHYQYLVEVSTDDRDWQRVVDMSKNQVKATSEGHEHKIEPVEAGYLRVTMLKNSANPGVHLVEVRAHGTGGRERPPRPEGADAPREPQKPQVPQGAGSALKLNGEDQWVELPNPPERGGGNNRLSLEAWVKADPVPEGVEMAIVANHRQWYGYYFGVRGAHGDKLRLAFHNVGVIGVQVTEPVVPANTWVHVAVSFEAEKGVRKLTHFYVNGKHVKSFKGGRLDWPDTNQKGRTPNIGRSPGPQMKQPAPNRYFSGCIDELRIWNTTRTPNEILAFYSAELTGREEGLGGYFKFNMGEGGEVIDSSLVGGRGAIHHGEEEVEWVESGSLSGPPPGRAEVEVEKLEFGDHELTTGPAKPQGLTITNRGKGALIITEIGLAGADPDEFRVASDTSEDSLGEGQSRLVQVAFAPFSAGGKSATLKIGTNDPKRLSVQIPLTGTAALSHPPVAPSGPVPPDESSKMLAWMPLRWGRTPGAVSYGLHLWKEGNSKPEDPTATVKSDPAEGPSFTPASYLEFATSYRWQVVASNGLGATPGMVWAFTTQSKETVKPPPFDISPKAQAERRKLYEATGRASLTGKDTPLKDGMKISFFGDSITMQGGYIRNIQKALKEGEGTKGMRIEVFKHGLNGGRVPTVFEGKSPWGELGGTMQELLDRDKPDVVSIFLGVNDVWHGKNGTTPEAFEAGLRKMIAMCEAVGAKVVLATLAVLQEDGARLKPKCDQYAVLTRKVAAETNASLVDLRKAFVAYLRNNGTVLQPDGTVKCRGKLLTYDGVHANAEGNEVLADLIAQGICEALKRSSGL